MSGTSTVTTKGQVTIPEALRQLYKIAVGDKVYFEADSAYPSAIKLTKVTSVVNQLAGSLHIPGIKYIDIETLRQKAGKELGKKYRIK